MRSRYLTSFLLLLLSTTTSHTTLVSGDIQKCHFNSPQQLESCRATLWSTTQEACPSNFPASGVVTLSELFNTSGSVRDKNYRYWEKTQDQSLSDRFYQSARGNSAWEYFLVHIAGWNLATVAAALASLWLVSILLVLIPCCCITCCCSRKKLRAPSSLVIICGLALATCLAGIISLYRTGKETSHLQDSIDDIRCLFPQSAYAALYLDVQGSAGSYSSLTELNRQVGILETGLHQCSTYSTSLSSKSLLKFATHGIYGPFLWTDRMLSQSLYNDWTSALPSSSGASAPYTLNHTILGYRALQLAGVIGENETVGPYAHVFAAIDAQSEANWDQSGVTNALNSLTSYIGDSTSFINTILTWISDAINNDVYGDLLLEDYMAITAPLYSLAYVPIIGLLGGFGLFIIYMLRHDNRHRTRHAGRGRIALTGFFCFGYAFFGIFLMFWAALFLVAVRIGHAGCDFVDRGILTEGSFKGLVDLTQHEQNAVDKCVKRGGDGDLISTFIDLDSTNILESFIGDSWDFNLNENLTFTQAQLDLQKSDHLGLVVPILNSVHPILTQTATELFWGTVSPTTQSIDCSLTGNYYVCEALNIAHSGGAGLDSTLYPWVKASPLTLYGFADGSKALTKLVAETSCQSLTVCVDRDTTCNSDFRIGSTTVGHIPENLVVEDVSSNWGKITDHASRVQSTKEVFECFSSASKNAQLAWVNGVRWVVLRDLINQKQTRPADSLHNDQTVKTDGFPGYFDSCPSKESCYSMASFSMNGTHLTHRLVSAADAMANAKQELQLAYAHRDVQSVVELVRQVALIANPLYKLNSSVKTLAGNFNCALIGDGTEILRERLCPGLMGSLAQLATMWFAVSTIHLVAFLMTFIYWFQRKRSLAREPPTPLDAAEDSGSLMNA